MIRELGDMLVYGDSMTVEDIIIDVLQYDVDHEQETKKIVDTVVSEHERYSRADVVCGLFQLEYEGRIYQVFSDEWKINPGWC